MKQIRFGESREGSRIVFELDDRPKYHAEISAADGALHVSLSDVTSAGAQVGPFNGAVTEIRHDAAVGAARYRLVPTRSSAIKNTFILPPKESGGAYRLVIDLAPTPAVAVYTENALSQAALTLSQASYARTKAATFKANGKTTAQAPEPVADFALAPRPLITWKNPGVATVEYEPLRLRVTQSQRLGAEVVAAQKYLQTGGLDASKSWRSEIDAAYGLVDDGATTADLSFGLFSTHRPLAATRGGIATDTFDRWRGNTVADAAFAVSALKGRLNVASGVAFSETTLTYGLGDEPWLRIYEEDGLRSRSHRDAATFQKLGVVLADSKSLEASFDLLYVSTGNDFRSFQSNTVADVLYEGETLNLSGRVVAGNSKFEIYKEAHADDLYTFDRNTFRLTQGAVALKATIVTESASSSGIVLFDDAMVGGRLSFDIGAILGVHRLLPDEVSVGYSEKSARAETLFNKENALRRSIGIGGGKSGENFSTDVYVFWNAHNDFDGASDFAASSEFGVDVAQSFFGDGWDLSLYAGMSDLKRRRIGATYGSERTLTGGMSFSKDFEKLPDVKISFDAFNFAGDYVEADEAFRNHDLTLQAEFDVSELLITGQPHLIDRARPLSIYLGAYQGWSVSQDALLGSERDPDTRVLLLLRRSR